MDKASLLALLQSMLPEKPPVSSADSISWHAYRRAEALEDPGLLPLLREIIEENRAKEKKTLRKSAYFVMASLLKKTMLPEYCQFYLDRMKAETDIYVLSAMLTNLLWMHIPEEVRIDALVECTNSEKWLVRYSAIEALRASDSEKSREAARGWVSQPDEKAYKAEIIYANASLGYIGEPKDIELLEKHIHSRIRDIRESAQYAIESIRSRGGCP